MDVFDRLAGKTGSQWTHLAVARRRTRELLDQLGHSMRDLEQHGTSLVVFGSIGRDEVTEGSDVDWALLVDGPADPEHIRIVEEAERRFVAKGLSKPGKSGTFASIVASHDLIHHIGGIEDTNHNLTRRILLLLESKPLTGMIVHERVVHGILARYVVHDRPVPSERPRLLIPHFLLNDFVRYWRTITVDYAAKRWEEPEGKWALRNIKLRLSRKLLLAAGLLIAFRLELEPSSLKDAIRGKPPELLSAEFSNYLEALLRSTPLEILAGALDQYASVETTRIVLDSYDAFLGILADCDKRGVLEALHFDEAQNDPVWIEARQAGRDFGRGLLQLFYHEDTPLRDLTLNFGLF